MSIVHPDGYVVDVIGPFQANFNDDTITKEILETHNSSARWLKGTGQIIVDRDFRDVIQAFTGFGI